MDDASYYFDQHAPRSIAFGLRRLGVDVLTASEDGAADWTDPEILDRATALERVVFSCDADFLELASVRAVAGPEFARIVYAHQLHITVGQAVRDLELIARVLTLEETRDQIIHLPL